MSEIINPMRSDIGGKKSKTVSVENFTEKPDSGIWKEMKKIGTMLLFVFARQCSGDGSLEQGIVPKGNAKHDFVQDQIAVVNPTEEPSQKNIENAQGFVVQKMKTIQETPKKT
jgi:hypothetical protein